MAFLQFVYVELDAWEGLAGHLLKVLLLLRSAHLVVHVELGEKLAALGVVVDDLPVVVVLARQLLRHGLLLVQRRLNDNRRVHSVSRANMLIFIA